MTDIATHVRIFNPNPSDDLVTKRTAAVKDLATRNKKSRKVAEILQTANDLASAVEAKGKVSEALNSEIEAAVRKAGAGAFVASEEPMQVIACALLGALQVLETATPTSGEVQTPTVLAIGLWSALSFQAPRTEPKLEALREELMTAAREHVIMAASGSRRRMKVPDVKIAPAEPFDAANVVQSTTAGVEAAFNALRTNAAIDREEIDLLWWVLSDWSEVLKRRYSAAPNAVATAIASGIEAGRMLRRMPGDAHRDLVLRQVGNDASFSLAELLTALADERERMGSLYTDNALVMSCPAVFPLVTALVKGSASHAKSKAKRRLAEWAQRALLESSALHVTALLPSVTA